MSRLVCPDCTGWAMMAVEVATRSVPTDIILDDDHEIILDVSPSSEFVHSMESSVITGYKCGNPNCGFHIGPVGEFGKLREVSDDAKLAPGL